jgi:hypothetical protein
MVNKNRLKQLFVSMAKSLPEPGFQIKRDDGQSGPIVLTESLVMRGDMVLYGEPADLYSETLEKMCEIILVNKAWNKDAVDSVLGNHLHEIASADISQRPGIIIRESTAFLNDLEIEPKQWIIDLSIYGMHIDCAELRFGSIQFKVDIVRSRATLPGIIEANSDIQVLFARVCLEAIDKPSALERAREIVDRHLLILNAICARFAPSITRLTRDAGQHRSTSLSRAAQSEEEIEGATFHVKNIAFPLMRNEYEECVAERGGEFLSTLLVQEHPFALRLLGAFETAGAACIERKSHLSFLLFAIALESAVLGSTNKSELTFQLSSRVAHLISTDLDARRNVSRTVSRLYDLRSRIVHTGETNASQADLSAIRIICMTSLVALARESDFSAMQNAEDLEKWFRDRLLR